MKTLRDDPFPLEACRDLLALTRALWAAGKDAGAPQAHLDRIAAVGNDLRVALELARESRTGTIGHAAAWERGERACEELGHLVGILDAAEPLWTAMRRRAGLRRG